MISHKEFHQGVIKRDPVTGSTYLSSPLEGDWEGGHPAPLLKQQRRLQVRGSEQQWLLDLVHKRGRRMAPCRLNSGPGCTASRGLITVPSTPAVPPNKGKDDSPWDSSCPKVLCMWPSRRLPHNWVPSTGCESAECYTSSLGHSLSLSGPAPRRACGKCGERDTTQLPSHGLLFQCGGPPHKRYNELQRGQLRKLHIH